MNRIVTQPLTPEEQFAACDFTKRDQIVALFPDYMQEQIKLRSNTKKPISKAVNIEGFTLKTPFGDRTLLKNTNLILEAGKRQCLFGPNASGKTLLFTQMAERKIKDFPRHIHVHHCRELETHELHDSVLDTVVKCYPYRNILVKVEAHLQKLLAADPAPAADVKSALQENLDFIQFSINSIKGTDADARLKAAKMLRVLGFDDIGQQKLCSALSGGLRMRVALCMAFFIEADLLLLDEPTNHLDFPSVLWLENRLRGYKGSFLLVSHDRELLNKVCTAVLLLEDCQIRYYPMGFSEFEKKKAQEDKKKYEDTEKFLKKNPNADPSTMLGRQRHDAKEWADNYHRKQIALAGKFTFPAPTPLSNDQKQDNGDPVAPEDISLINMKNLRFSYDEKTGHWIFNDPISFNCTASTRVGVMGPNGAGKSTFLKLLTGKLIPNSGDIITHPAYTLAYFGQHSTAELDLEKTATEFMESQFPKVTTGLLKQHLAKTGIMGPVADTRMHRLSFSQRSCIVFAKLTFVCPHLLIMDEPTNFLDLESVDSLIGACNKYKGALLLVSHNRDFLKKCAKQYLSIVPGQFNIYNDLKTAERSTYTFIEEMEEGGKVGASALANNPGGGTVHSSQKVGAAAEEEKKVPAQSTGGIKVISLTSSKPAVAAVSSKPANADASGAIPKPKPAQVDTKIALPKVVAPADNSPTEVVYLDGEKCLAKWKDGKFYSAVVKKYNVKDGKYTVLYTDYGNTSAVPPASLKKLDAAPSGKKAPASAMAS